MTGREHISMSGLKVLALEPYYGGSHQAFLDGWIARSRHEWTLMTLTAAKWKWRMRNSAVTLRDKVREALAAGASWDVLFCSDMLNLAEFLGLGPEPVRRLPKLVYFHENQLTYPKRNEDERDYHFVYSNMTTAMAADRVWFNSRYHMEEFLEGLRAFLKRMPDNQKLENVDRIRAKSEVHYPPVENGD